MSSELEKVKKLIDKIADIIPDGHLRSTLGMGPFLEAVLLVLDNQASKIKELELLLESIKWYDSLDEEYK